MNGFSEFVSGLSSFAVFAVLAVFAVASGGLASWVPCHTYEGMRALQMPQSDYKAFSDSPDRATLNRGLVLAPKSVLSLFFVAKTEQKQSTN